MPRGVPESQEIFIGSSLDERARTLLKMPYNSLGPLDLCAIRKTGTASIVGMVTGGTSESGFYHRVAGTDVSSIAAISAYFFDLVSRQGRSSIWSEGGSMQLKGGVFCVFNPFANVDLRVEFSNPGDVDYAVFTRDGQIDETKVDNSFWEQIMLASALRALSVIQNRGLHVHLEGPVRCNDPLNSIASVTVLTELVVAHFADAEATGCPSKYIDDTEIPAASCLMSLIFTHLSNSGRYGEGLAIMGACVREDPLGKYSKRRRSNVAVIIVRVIFISLFLFYCLLCNHSFPTNPNKITNCFKLILSVYNLQLNCSCVAF